MISHYQVLLITPLHYDYTMHNNLGAIYNINSFWSPSHNWGVTIHLNNRDMIIFLTSVLQ